MLRVCSSALLLSGVPHFVSHISEIAKDVGVELEVSDEWNINYRLNCEVIICGSKYLPFIDSVNYSKVRLILKTTETVSEFVEIGITHFIFDYNNTKEVAFSFFTDEISSDTDTVYNIMTSSGKTCFVMIGMILTSRRQSLSTVGLEYILEKVKNFTLLIGYF